MSGEDCNCLSDDFDDSDGIIKRINDKNIIKIEYV